MAGSSNSVRAGRAFVEIFADSSSLVRGLRAAERHLVSWGKSVRSLGTKMMGLGTSIIAPLVSAGIAAGSFANDLKLLSSKTGAGVETLSGLAFAADQSGVSMDGLGKALIFMHKNLYAAGNGLKTAVSALSALGLTYKQMALMSPEEQFLTIAERIAQIENPTQRAAIAMKIFGRAGASLLPLLNQGSAAIGDYIAEAKRLGVTMSTEDVEAAASFYEKMEKLWWVIKNGLIKAIGESLIPLLSNMAAKMTKCAASAGRWIKENKGVVVMALWLGAGFVAAGGGLYAFGTAIVWVGKVCGTIANGFKLIKTALVWLFSPLGTIIALVAAAVGAFLYFSGYGAEAISWLGARFNELKQDAITAFDGISKALAKGDIALAAKIAWLFVKMEWLKAKQYLLEIWLSLKAKVLEYWYGLVYSLADAWNGCLYGIEVGWIEMVAFLKGLWTGFKEFFGNTVDWIAEKMMGIWIWWQKLLDPNFDDKFAKDYVRAQFDKDKKDRTEQTDKDLLAVENDRTAKRSDARREYESLTQGSQQSLTDDLKTINDESARRIKENADALAKVKGEFDASIAAANEPLAEKQPKKPPLPKDWSANGMDRASSVGTFSAWGLGQLGAGSVMQKIADYTLRTAEATEDMADSMSDGAAFD